MFDMVRDLLSMCEISMVLMHSDVFMNSHDGCGINEGPFVMFHCEIHIQCVQLCCFIVLF